MRLSPAQIATIEFSNDGFVDSLTVALAPAQFFRLLEREASISDRSGSSLLLLSIRMELDHYFDALLKQQTSSNQATSNQATSMQTSLIKKSTSKALIKNVKLRSEKQEERFSPTEAVARIESLIINQADLLSENLRTGDFFTRYSDTGFVALLRGSQIEFHLAEKRLSEIFSVHERSLRASSPIWKINSLIRDKAENQSHLIGRLDRIHFS